jgi:hypothetical protein
MSLLLFASKIYEFICETENKAIAFERVVRMMKEKLKRSFGNQKWSFT